MPVYVNPDVNIKAGHPTRYEDVEGVKKAIEENPDAKAVLVNNPTYYGICSDLKADCANWPMPTTCWCWWTRPTEPIFTSGKICRITAMAAGADMACRQHAQVGRQPDPELLSFNGTAMSAPVMCGRSST